MSIEGMGRWVGRNVLKPRLEAKREQVEWFEVSVEGEEHLRAMGERPYLLVANHLKPDEALATQSGLSPDAFILESLVHKVTGRELAIIAKSDDGWWAENLYRYFQKHVGQPFGKGMVEGAGLVPLLKNPGSFNRDFLKAVERLVEARQPILIFPEGNWYQDFDPSHPLEPGAAHIALKHDLPMLPVYIHGATSWKPGQQVAVRFGEAFDVEGKSKEAATQEIRDRLSLLSAKTPY